MRRLLFALLVFSFFSTFKTYAVTPSAAAIANSNAARANCTAAEVVNSAFCQNFRARQAAEEERERQEQIQNLLSLVGPAAATVGAVQNRFGGDKKKNSTAKKPNSSSTRGAKSKPNPKADLSKKTAQTPSAKALGSTCSCLLYTSPSPRDQRGSRMPSSA